MIPIHLRIAGFLSYREPVELDFTRFSLACISGANGAGKSSLLDAIIWCLFGTARKSDESLINSQSLAAEIRLTFAYEGNIYRVQRSRVRGKMSSLEFQIFQGNERWTEQERQWMAVSGDEGVWKALTERTLRETEARIEQTLRMDYETFANASFFLQGKADKFTQQGASDRKRILGSILGLDAWETYRQEAAERRRRVEEDVAGIDGQLREIIAELEEEPERARRLQDLEGELGRASRQRVEQEAIRESLRRAAAAVEEQQKLVEALKRQLERAEGSLDELTGRLEARRQERQAFNQVLERAGEIEAAYQAWQASRQKLESLEEIAGRFREQEKQQAELQAEIDQARARLAEEQRGLLGQGEDAAGRQAEIARLRPELEAVQVSKRLLEEQAARKEALEAALRTALEAQSQAKAENASLKKEMDELKPRIDQLERVEGAVCPLCGQALSSLDRQALVEALKAQGREMGDRYRANRSLVEENDDRLRVLEKERETLGRIEVELRGQSGRVANLESRLELLERQQSIWAAGGAVRLAEVQQALEQENYAREARARLEQIQADLRATGYDAAAHDQARRAEQRGRQAEMELRELEKGRAALEPLERQIAELDAQTTGLEEQVQRQQAECQQAAELLAAAAAQMPDLAAAEELLFEFQERENHLRQAVGAARQLVLVLEDLKERRKTLEGKREALARQIGLYKQLERAFSKDGVPALLIEQALPQIEAKANEILDRLSGGNMSVSFVTQAAYKNKKRDDLRETLDIRISDNSGQRDYEMFSGGEAFRINFAIRLALSEVLAQRAGARLQTLVIDEGFGSQDAEGRQRLIEAINLVRADFAKILVITHIDELKDAFPNRIEVEKTARGSMVQVI